MVRLGALCRRRLGTPLRRAPTDLAGWVIEAERLWVAPCTETRIRFTVRVSRSRASANAIGSASSKNPEVECCTVNKACASFKVGELRLKGSIGDAIRLARSRRQGLWTDPEQDHGAFFRVRRPASAGIRRHCLAYRRGTRREPLAQSRKQDRLFGYRRTPVKLAYQSRKKSGVFRQ